MAALPQLDDNGKNVLRIMLTKSVANGRELLKSSNLEPNALSGALRILVNARLIDASALDFGPENLKEVYFNVLPSSMNIAKVVAS
jgi:hypothetical protein